MTNLVMGKLKENKVIILVLMLFLIVLMKCSKLFLSEEI